MELIAQGYPLWVIEIHSSPWSLAAQYDMDVSEVKAVYADLTDVGQEHLDSLDAVNVVRVVGWRVPEVGDPEPVVIGSLIEGTDRGWERKYEESEQDARKLALRILRGICEYARKPPRTPRATQ